MYRIEKYNTEYYTAWNEFVAKSKNGTFLFHRDFMEYHKDRFEDFSLLIFDKKKLIAVLPANVKGDEVYSHQGLTYGGLVYNNKLKLNSVLQAFQSVLFFLRQNNISKLTVKSIPYIYHRQPAQELEYVLFICNASLIRRDSLAVIENSSKIKTASNRLEGVKKAKANNLEIIESNNFSPFWDEILIPNLQSKYNTNPVHSLAEITKLKERFSENIKHYIVKHRDTIVAGTVLFETDTVVHAQYISANETKNELGSLDFLYHHLITNVYLHKKFFDFGISNEQQGRKLNEGLQFWKEGFGARTVVHDFYEVDISGLDLNNVFV